MTETTCEKKNSGSTKRWFVLRVQSNREERVRDNLVKLFDLENVKERIPEVLVPTEAVTEMHGGKRQVIQRKLYPGYVIVQVEVDQGGNIPQDLWYLVRETSGVGDFIGGEKPWPMLDEEVGRMLGRVEEVREEAPKLQIDFKEGEMVQIKDGPFKGVEGYVEEVNPASGKVRVVINIFNRSTPVELEYWQVQRV